ncbi:MAG: RNA polymerase sigma-70 factor, ECF subfamily [Chloroflexi bacterium]|nr:MAG: RNA polymerase sigma-70 factor, ECF subfamily [Chloroflexota bacterium]
MNWQDHSDPELMQAIGRQEVQAFEALYDRYSRLVFSTAYRVLGDAHSAEDVVQDVFVRLWRNPERYVEERGRFLGWMLSVTRNRSIDEVRSRKRRPLNDSQVGDPEDSGSLADDTASEAASREMAGAELVDQREMVRKALADLPPEQRLAIELAYYSGLTQAEIAERLSTPLGTVKTRIRLGMQKMRVALEGRVGVLDMPAAGSATDAASAADGTAFEGEGSVSDGDGQTRTRRRAGSRSSGAGA